MCAFLGLVVFSINVFSIDGKSELPIYKTNVDSEDLQIESLELLELVTCISNANKHECKPGMCVRLNLTELCTDCVPGFLLIDGVCVGKDSDDVVLAGCDIDATMSMCLSCTSAEYHIYNGGCFSISSEILGFIQPFTSTDILTCDENIYGPFPPVSGKCKKGHCTVDLGGNKYCSRCSVKSEYLVDGKCISSTNNGACVAQDVPDGTCKSCGAGYFLYRSGCYSINNGAPGSLICKELDTVSGICKICQDGFFRLPEPAADRQSCMLCNDTSEYEYEEDPYYYYSMRTFVGIKDCTKCTFKGEVSTSLNKPACEECSSNYYLLSMGDSTMCVSSQECSLTYFQKTINSINTCVFCADTSQGGIDGCSKCTYTSDTNTITCQSCLLYHYKKTTNGVVSCVTSDECVAPYYTKDSDNVNDIWNKQCLLCSDTIQDCIDCTHTSGKLKCTSCNGQKKPNADGSTCHVCNILHCEECSSDGVCSRCATGYTVSSNSCVVDPNACLVANCVSCEYNNKNKCSVCQEGFYKYGATCQRCTAGCVACTGANKQCTSCEHGYFLLKSGQSNSGDCVIVCGDGYYEDAASRICVKCTVDRCKRCAGPGVCTHCQDDLYLKLMPSSTECVEAPQCYGASFPRRNPDTGNKCVPCGDNIAGISDCTECAFDGNILSCFKCKEGSVLDLLRRTCVTECPEHSNKELENGAMACVCQNTYTPNDDGTFCELTKECSQYEGCERCNSLDMCAQCSDRSAAIQLDGKTCQQGCPSGATIRHKKCHCMGGKIPNGNVCADPPGSDSRNLSAGMITAISVASVAVVTVIIGCVIGILLKKRKSGSMRREPSLFRPLSS